MSAYLFNGMDEWYERTHGHINKYKPIPVEKHKEKAVEKKMPKRIHYGDDRNKQASKVKEYTINGHDQIVWSDGNITCNCNGWVFKRAGIKRECTHVRELYGKLKGIPKPDKTPKPEMSDKEKLARMILKRIG